MSKLNEKEFYFAECIDDIVYVENFEGFVEKNRKLYNLYNRLTKYGLFCEFEYLYHNGCEVIHGIIISEFKFKDESDPGLPGIMVICKDEKLHLIANY